MNKKNVVIVGPAASGKDTLRKRLEEKGYIYCKLHTTRPKRDGESNNDYYFDSEEEFAAIDSVGGFVVKNTYNGWKYGIETYMFEKANLFVLTPEYINELGEDFISNSFIIYLNPDIDTRIERLCRRNDADDVLRRIESDEEQFLNFTMFDIEITNPNFCK